MNSRLVVWLEEIGRESVHLVGGKGANLGEMIRVGMPVPPGFAITTEAYKRFMEETGAAKAVSQCLARVGSEAREQYHEISRMICGIMETREMPTDIQAIITEHYKALGERCKCADVPVAVRSSGVAEDLASASFAGQHDTYLNVRGARELLLSVIRCWASLFTPRAMGYRVDRGMALEGEAISVSVQKLVDVCSAGVCFTIDPVSGDRSKVMIEGNWGLGESVVQGLVTPDRWVVNKETLKIQDVTIGQKAKQIVPLEGKTIEEDVAPEKQNQSCLPEEAVEKLAELAHKLELHYGMPQDVEWAVDSELPFPENIFLVQTRPVTVIAERSPTDRVLDRLLGMMRRSE